MHDRCPDQQPSPSHDWAALIGALGLVLNTLVLFTTRYMDDAANQLRADGFNVRDEDVARLSPFVRHHSNMVGPPLLPSARSARRCEAPA